MKKAKIFYGVYKNYCFNWKPIIMTNRLLWKEKWGTPRCEIIPQFRFDWLWFGFYISVGDDQYWEQWLWWKKYSDSDIIKAEKTWPWVNLETKKPSWKKY
jgi:hypothetical protein